MSTILPLKFRAKSPKPKWRLKPSFSLLPVFVGIISHQQKASRPQGPEKTLSSPEGNVITPAAVSSACSTGWWGPGSPPRTLLLAISQEAPATEKQQH